jgi:hypothetical protein
MSMASIKKKLINFEVIQLTCTLVKTKRIEVKKNKNRYIDLNYLSSISAHKEVTTYAKNF